MSAPAPRVGVFGGSFNPPHVAHVLACHFALMAWGLDRVVVVPAFSHPFAKELAPFEHRLAMARLAFAHLGGTVEVSPLEGELGGVSYTVDTVRELARRNPGAALQLVVGSDVAGELHLWRDWEILRELAPPLVVPRMVAGSASEGQEGAFHLPAISSSEVRGALARGGDAGLALPRAVREYIARHGLYGG